MIESHVEQIAKTAAIMDPFDLPALISLGQLFDELCEMLDISEMGHLYERAKDSAGLLESIVMHEIEDLDATFAEINKTIEYAQEIIQTVQDGGNVTDVAIPCAAEATNNQDIDHELLEAWISGCADILDELESLTIGLESEFNVESLDEVRRGIHTLKGECGVLSLSVAQKICHEAETLIDETTTHSHEFPANEILAVIDWLKGYIQLLETNPSAQAPNYDAVTAMLTKTVVAEEDSTAGNTNNKTNQQVQSEPADAEVTTHTSEQGASEESDTDNGCDPEAIVEFPDDIERDETLAEFLGEAREHISGAEEALLSLESDFTDDELINTVFRSFHTIKGVAGFMHLSPIVEAAHNAEFLLDEARKTTITLDSSYLDLILESCDIMSKLLNVLDGDESPKLVLFNHHIKQLQHASRGEPFETSRGKKQAVPADAITTETKPANRETSDTQSKAAASKAGNKKKVGEVNVKVNSGRLDNLVTMVGELVIAQQMVIQDPSVQTIDEQRFQRNLSQAGKIIRDLQEVAMSLRMVTLKGLFQKMARLVRDVATKADKNVLFVMEGEDTELDRTVVEEIGDPLVHMIRNSCDHGIESAEDRIKAGKSPAGTLTLRAYHQGGSIMIEIEDDGKGLDRNKILQKAIEKGIYTPDRELDEIPDSEVFNLIMLPGFSTADKVTDISGRGVGMDVVRRNIEALRGKLEIQSVAGEGTTFRMSLPLTMAIIDGMIVRVGSQRYVIPTLSIEQSFRPTSDEISTVAGKGEMVIVRDSLLPIFRLNKIFNLNEGTDCIEDGLLLVLESNDTRCCLLIDEIIGQQQVVIKRLGQGVASLRGTSGGAILGDGRVALIIDVAGMLAEATQSETILSEAIV
jgi:two-component system chemotaxis sensor kinase CheA